MKKQNLHNYISLGNYNVEEGTKSNLTVGTDCIIEHEELDFKKLYHKHKIRGRLIKGTTIEGIYIHDEESEEKYMSYVKYVKRLIDEKKIYKVTKK
jgi:hypothetical protein